jgi:hypothetical protein
MRRNGQAGCAKPYSPPESVRSTRCVVELITAYTFPQLRVFSARFAIRDLLV